MGSITLGDLSMTVVTAGGLSVIADFLGALCPSWKHGPLPLQLQIVVSKTWNFPGMLLLSMGVICFVFQSLVFHARVMCRRCVRWVSVSDSFSAAMVRETTTAPGYVFRCRCERRHIPRRKSHVVKKGMLSVKVLYSSFFQE